MEYSEANKEKSSSLWSAHAIVLKIIGVVLLVAAVLKGWELLTRPVAGSSIWTSRSFLIAQVELELFLGIWLLSGLYRRAAWLVGLVCFAVFSMVTLYKGLSGAESCGCFGSVPVNPWITLFMIDFPILFALVIVKPKGKKWCLSLPHKLKLENAICFLIVVLGSSTVLLALNEPSKITSYYEVLEPESWVGQRLPIIEHIDISDQLEQDNWIILLYHHDCHDCQKAILKFEQIAKDFVSKHDFHHFALVEVPPYGKSTISKETPCLLGVLDDRKIWYVTTPVFCLLNKGNVLITWEKDIDINKFMHIVGQYLFISN